MSEEIMESTVDNIKTERSIKRGGWLTAYLVLMFIANSSSSYSYFVNANTIIELVPKAGLGIIYFLGAISLFNVILTAGVWFWRKWGVYGFYSVAVIAFFLNLYLGMGVLTSLLGLLGAFILFLLTRNKWSNFT